MDFHNLIAGKSISAPDWMENRNPSDLNDVAGSFPLSDETEVATAVEAARSAFPGWCAASPVVRHAVLQATAYAIAADTEAFANDLSCEEGKTLSEARAEVEPAAQIFAFFAGEVLRSGGEAHSSVRPGGKLAEQETRGHFMSPVLLIEATNNMRIAREEIFGPMAAAIRARDYEEALHFANDSEFGLSAGICTSSLSRAMHFRRECTAGMVIVNLPTAGVDFHVPFGGRKSSSYGPREQGAHARNFYNTTRAADFAPGN